MLELERLEGTLERGGRLLECKQLHRAVGRPGRVLDGLLHVPERSRLEEVVRERGEVRLRVVRIQR
jgi:hypothetical protein